MIPVYSDDGIQIVCADVREVADDLRAAGAALAIVDPPYGVDFAYDEHEDSRQTYPEMLEWLVPLALSLAPLVMVTPGVANVARWPEPDWTLAWHKPGSTRRNGLGGFNTWEPVLVYGRRRIYQDAVILPSGLTQYRNGETGDHPCPKPLRLMSWLVAIGSEAGDLVIDPMMGSGTTLRAAMDLGRRAVGVDMSENYCQIAARRLGQRVLDLETYGGEQLVLLEEGS